MKNLNKKCELCSMRATHDEIDKNNITYNLCEHHSLKEISVSKSVNNHKRLLPLFYVFSLIIFLSTIRQFTNDTDLMTLMMDFMGIFFLTFGLFKLYDLNGFAVGFSTYDVIAKKWFNFGYIYPFLEIGLGVMYLAGFMFLGQNLVALTLAGLGIYSAYAVINKKEEVQCVCLGTVFNLPMTNVTLIENGIMFVMILFMLVM